MTVISVGLLSVQEKEKSSKRSKSESSVQKLPKIQGKKVRVFVLFFWTTAAS